MGLVSSTGFFQYIPPTPALNSLSKTTAEIGEKVTIFGENLDYVDRLKFADELINFNLVSENNIDFVVPPNPSTGLLKIESDGINIIKKELPFLPIFQIEEISPTFGPSGEEITVKGKVLNSIISGDILADPLDSDLDYLFLNEDRSLNSVYYRFQLFELTYLLPSNVTGFFTGSYPFTGFKNFCFIKNSSNSGLNIVFNEFICKNSESGGFVLKNVSDFTPNSGYISKIQIESDYEKGNLLQDSYELHTYNFPIIDNDYMKSNQTRISQGDSILINFENNFTDTGYGVFFNVVFSGTGVTQDSFQSEAIYGTIYDKTPSGFRIELNSTIPYELNINYLAIKYGTGFYDSGNHRCGTIPFSVETGAQINNIIYFDNDKDYQPFIATCLYKLYPTGIAYIDEFGGVNPTDPNPSSNGFNMFARYYNLDAPFLNHSVHSFTNNSFKVDTSMIDTLLNNFLPTGKIYVDYLIIDNPATNLNNFTYQGTGSFYKKTLLFTGDSSTFQKRIPIRPANINIQNKNTLKFNLPTTNYHINGKLILRNINNLEKVSDQSFLETPLATKVEPDELYRGTPFLIRGKSFKKPILIDGTGYNEAIVRFDYQEQLFLQKNSDFEMAMKILDVNTLSGNVPVGNLPSGIYKIQMIDENRRIYE